MTLRYKTMIKSAAVFGLALLASVSSFAGNPDRAGSAGASYLLVNPWARSAALGGAFNASVTGIEATYLNVAGLAFTKKTELAFTNSSYLVGADININAAGFAQRVGETGVFGVTVTAFGLGDIQITQENLPEGGIGSYSPVNAVISVAYAKEFSNSIYGGLQLKVISESISNVKAQGIAFDAGIRYVTGENDKLKFAISLKNVGPAMRFSGDGLSTTASILGFADELTLQARATSYELPALVNIGFTYDFLLSEQSKLTTGLQFTSNSFTRDNFGFGAEYGFREMFYLRAGYQWEDQLTNDDQVATAFTGPSAGATIDIPAGQNGTKLGFDYSYRATTNFNGVHSIGVHIDL